MLTRKNTIALLLAVVAAPAALAQADAIWVGGEIGWASRQIQGTRTRAEVLAELQQLRVNPVLADGSTYVGGERGYVEHRHSYTVRDGVMVHTPPFTATMGINAASPYQRSERQPGREPWEVMPY
jgi:hypothetical protein